MRTSLKDLVNRIINEVESGSRPSWRKWESYIERPGDMFNKDNPFSGMYDASWTPTDVARHVFFDDHKHGKRSDYKDGNYQTVVLTNDKGREFRLIGRVDDDGVLVVDYEDEIDPML